MNLARTMAAISLALVAALAAARPSGAQDGGFDDGEQASLARGALVSRPRREVREGRVFVGGSSYQAIERPRDEVWRAIHDVGAWRHMLPQTSETRPETTAGSDQLVFVRHTYGLIQASYTLRVRFAERPRRASFEIEADRPHDVRSAHGFMEVRAFPGAPERALVVWAFLADPGDNPLVSVFLPEIQVWSLRVPSTIREYLQGSGASLYQH